MILHKLQMKVMRVVLAKHRSDCQGDITAKNDVDVVEASIRA